MKRTASNLKQRRLVLNHTQKDAALHCGVSTRTWRRYESGRSLIPLSIWNWYMIEH